MSKDSGLPLSFDELKKIESLKLNKSLEKVRDLFLMECYTGLRFSDLSELRKENMFVTESHKKFKKEIDPRKPFYGQIELMKIRIS